MPRKPFKKHVRIPTPDYLANVALYYLSRYAASETSLRRVLDNRLRRATMAHPDFAADHAQQENLKRAIDAIVDQHKKSGVIDDQAFATMKVGSLRRSGKSARRITQQLRQKGIAVAVIETALLPGDGKSPDDAERQAAFAFAKRRGLGPFRRPSASPRRLSSDDLKRKDFAAMNRAGFSFDIVRAILGSDLMDNDTLPYTSID